MIQSKRTTQRFNDVDVEYTLCIYLEKFKWKNCPFQNRIVATAAVILSLIVVNCVHLSRALATLRTMKYVKANFEWFFSEMTKMLAKLVY